MSLQSFLFVVLCLLFGFVEGKAQLTINGTLSDAEDFLPIENATINYPGGNQLTDSAGNFELTIDALPVTINLSSLGYRNRKITLTESLVELKLFRDPLEMNTIVISDNRSKGQVFESINAVTAIENLENKTQNGIADLLSNVPGVFIDGSLGEVFTRVFTRGVAASAEDDIGWFYQSLQEDGMPISAVQYNYFTPDFFQRTDLTTGRLEAFRGGKSGVLFQNSPGGAFNFISTKPSQAKTEVKATLGLLGEGNAYSKIEALLPVKLTNKWAGLIGGSYRRDQGHRNVDYTWNQGGQLKGIIQGTFSNAVFSLRLKYLRDQVNRYTGLSAVNWESPQPAFGQDFNSTALMLPTIKSTIPGAAGYEFDSSKGIRPTEISIHPTYELSLNDWHISAASKWSKKSTEWNTSFANQPLGLESFLPYFLSGGQFPFGAVTFTDVASGTQLATVDNSGALNAFQGMPPEFQYLQGQLPNDALMGIAPWKKDDDLTEWMNQLRVTKEIGNHDIQLGFFHASSQLDYFTNAGFAYITFENEPRALEVTLQDFEGNELSLSDNSGLTNLGGLFFENGEFKVNQLAFHANDHIDIGDRWNVDVGLRYERVNHQGELQVPMPFENDGGIDGNPLTDYDNGQLVASGISQNMDFTYDYLSYSIGVGHAIADQHYVFGRFSKTNKAPELNVYIQNFSSLPIETPGEVQGVQQAELGYRFRSSGFSGSATAFSSSLTNVAISDFVFDQQTNDIFYSPTQFNSTTTTGVELAWTSSLSEMFSLSGSHTIQQAKTGDFTIYNSNGTADTSDDSVTDFSGNSVAQIPKLMSKISANLITGKLKTSLHWQHMGQREGNAENAFQLPAYNTFGLSAFYHADSHWTFSVQASNLFNSQGLMNFFGPNEFGSSANAATTEYINANPNGSFVVFPILPRAIYFSAHYTFSDK